MVTRSWASVGSRLRLRVVNTERGEHSRYGLAFSCNYPGAMELRGKVHGGRPSHTYVNIPRNSIKG